MGKLIDINNYLRNETIKHYKQNAESWGLPTTLKEFKEQNRKKWENKEKNARELYEKEKEKETEINTKNYKEYAKKSKEKGVKPLNYNQYKEIAEYMKENNIKTINLI